MCGIAGYWCKHGVYGEEILSSMTNAVTHRGPDDAGFWHDPNAGLALGHRRLSILDLSPEGHQPMFSVSGRYVIVFNGEVYNFSELRRDLESVDFRFRGYSDTEVMLAAIEAWGLKASVKRFIGMFGFALWDRETRQLSLVRDRLGIKPLFYGWVSGALVFGSELKALREYPGFDNPVNRNALALLLRHNYIPAPYSIYEGIYKLMPGVILQLDADTAFAQRSLEDLDRRTVTYWSAREITKQAADHRYDGSEADAVRQLDALLRSAIGMRMVADVPLGAFLSGGVDSSTVVALMQAQSDRPVKTFSIGFNESKYDEGKYAKAVARHLATDHVELYVTPQQTLNVIPELPCLYDEPFADSSQIPTFLVSKLARKHVTVILSGDGGDELFSGYNRYFWGRRLWDSLGWIPVQLRARVANGLRMAPSEFWDRVLEMLMPVLPTRFRVRMPGYKVQRLAEVLCMPSPDELYRQIVSHWPNPADVVLDAFEPPTALTDLSRRATQADYTERMMYTDLVSYMPDDILTKVDRASMGVSLEARVPLIDHRVVEFAWRLPLNLKIRNGEGKWLLRQVLYQYVPRQLIDRPKMGFGVPIDDWLRGPLRDWAEALLDKTRLQQEGFFDPGPIRHKWEEHISGRGNWQYLLWDILTFQAWLEKWH